MYCNRDRYSRGEPIATCEVNMVVVGVKAAASRHDPKIDTASLPSLNGRTV